MDYQAWGQEYLYEAERISRRLGELKLAIRLEKPDRLEMLMDRIAMLRTMRLECLHTGRFLLERGRRE